MAALTPTNHIATSIPTEIVAAGGAKQSEVPMLSTTTPQRHKRLLYLSESIVVFALGVALMHFAYSGSGKVPIENVGVPGHDSFYHIKMAAMLGEHGLRNDFPWLRFVYFTREGPDFVSHHYGFHALLWPFVQLSYALTGDYLTGGRWATEVFFGIVLVLFNMLLIRGRVPWRPLWLLLFVFMPYQFFTRHAFVRAITPAMAFMLLTLISLHGRRPLWTAITVFGFTHLYLGGVIYAPIVVGCVVLAESIGPSTQRCIPWKLLTFSIGGWLIGVLTYPYASGTIEFLKLQVFGSGLSPDIGVGQEWYPYENVWWFAQMCGPLLCVWMLALCTRLRFGPTVDSREWSLVLLTLVFFVLNLKARRFIEYWPILSLLSAAYLAAPSIRLLTEDPAEPNEPTQRRGVGYTTMFLLAAGASTALLIQTARRSERVLDAVAWWPIFAAIAAAYFLVWAVRQWTTQSVERRLLLIIRGLGVASVLFFTGVTLGSPLWHFVRRDSRCQYDLPVVRKLMAFLQEHSQPGDVVFTDDWDIFPVFFYHNTHNHYIVGLDPKFTQARRPELWERYVKVSRGQVPSDVTYKRADASGKVVEEPIHVKLEDIREHFGARFVITDSDHRALAGKLAAAPHFARLIYPSTDYASARDEPFLLFEIVSPVEAAAPAPETEPGKSRVLYLSSYRPEKAEQGWGDLGVDRSVTGGPLLLGPRPFPRGLGTHAPSLLEFRIPDGFDLFEAMVGIDRGSDGRGSVIATVSLDDQDVFVSPLLTGQSSPAKVQIELRGARHLRLKADPTPDGNRFDHVDWADARLVRLPDHKDD